jgi:hypothetical protein
VRGDETMTDKEHELMLAMFVHQGMAIKALQDVLRANNLLTDASLKGAHQSVQFAESETPDLIPRLEEIYKKTAKKLGVDFPSTLQE